MTEGIGPTPERLRQAHYVEQPTVDSKTNRTAAVIGDVFKKMFMAGELSHCEWKASEKFERHLLGVECRDVRQTDETDGQPDFDGMPAWQRHGIALARARNCLSKVEFTILERLVKDPRADALKIGVELSVYRDRRQQRAYGVAKIQTALDRLAVEWGMKAK